MTSGRVDLLEVRSEASKTALRSSYVLFFVESCRFGSVKLFFTEQCSRRDHLVFRFFFCPHLLCHFRFAPFAPQDNLFRFQAYTQHSSLFDFSNCQTYTLLNAYSSFSRACSRNKSPSSQSVALSLLFVTWTQQCVFRSSIDGSLFLISSWLL